MSEPEMYWKLAHWSRDAATVPDTNEIIRTGSSEQTWTEWTNRCRQLGLTFDNPQRVFGDCCCKALSPGLRAQACSYMDDNAPELLRRRKVVGVGDVFRFFRTAADWFRADETVPQELAEKRAATCRMCPHNSDPVNDTGTCATCTGLAQKLVTGAVSVLGGKHTESDPFLKACELCGCATAVLVHVPLDVLERHQEGVLDPPPWCWKVTERG